MKLTFRFSNFAAARCDMIHTGHMPPVTYRIVQLRLTEEQAALLHPRIIGQSSGKDMVETIEVVAIEEE